MEAMTTYRFCSTNTEAQASCLLDASTDDEACEIANALLMDAEFFGIEVWKDDRMIYRVARTAAVPLGNG